MSDYDMTNPNAMAWARSVLTGLIMVVWSGACNAGYDCAPNESQIEFLRGQIRCNDHGGLNIANIDFTGFNTVSIDMDRVAVVSTIFNCRDLTP